MYENALRDNTIVENNSPFDGKALVAWHGVGAEAPAAWNIVTATGSEKKGYMRVDGPSGESVEFRWEKARRLPDLELNVQDYLKKLQKETKRQKLEYVAGVRTGKRSKKDRPTDIRFQWSADRKGYGRFFWCRQCRRSVIVQVSGPTGSAFQKLAEKILTDTRDHSHDGRTHWGVYGLEFTVPIGFRLVRQRLMSGFLSLNFTGPGGRLIVERWGLAEMLLEKGFLDWHSREYLAELKNFRGDTWAIEHGNHEAVATEGYESGVRRVISVARGFGLSSRIEKFGSLAWHCPESNRIAGVRAFGPRALELARSVAATVRCH